MGAIDRFLQSIRYPERPRAVSDGVAISVDGEEVRVSERGGGLVFARTLVAGADADEQIQRLMELAAGRILKEEATLSYDPEREALILWQAVAANADETRLRRVFELFCTSCDWWTARTSGEAEVIDRMPEMVIRP